MSNKFIEAAKRYKNILSCGDLTSEHEELSFKDSVEKVKLSIEDETKLVESLPENEDEWDKLLSSEATLYKPDFISEEDQELWEKVLDNQRKRDIFNASKNKNFEASSKLEEEE